MSKYARMPRSLTLANDLRRLVSRLERAEGRFLSPHSLTPPQWAVLQTLANKGESPISKVGTATDITKGTLTGVIRRLEKAKLISTRPSRRDGRSRVAVLTDAGSEIVDRLQAPHAKLIRHEFRGLPRNRLRELTRLLRRRHRRKDG